MKLLSSLEGSSGSLLSGNIKMSTLGSYGEIYMSEDEAEVRSELTDQQIEIYCFRIIKQSPRNNLRT